MGSVAGGTDMVLTGRGFPDLSLGLGETVVVDVAGSPCTVLSSNFTHIVCATGPEPDDDTGPPAIEGVWPGERTASMKFKPGKNEIELNGMWLEEAAC